MIFCSLVIVGVLSKRRGRALRTPTTPRPASASASAMTPTVGLSLNYYTSVGQHRDLLASACRAGLPAHGGQLRPIAADIGHVMGDDQMVLGIDGDLHIVADNTSALTAGRHRAGIGIGQGDLFVGRGLNLLANLPEGLHLPPQALDLLLKAIVFASAISPPQDR